MEKTIENAVLECKLQSDKRWAQMELEIQKVKDDIHNVIHSDLVCFTSFIIGKC